MTPHIDLKPPTNRDISTMEQALARAGRSYSDDDLLDVMAWLGETQLSVAWLELVRAGRAALIVEAHHVRLVANNPKKEHE